MERTFDLNIAAERSEEFVLHFNALLSQQQQGGEGSGQFEPDGSYVSTSSGTWVVEGRELTMRLRLTMLANGSVRSVSLDCNDGDEAVHVVSFGERLIRNALANALSDRRETFFFRHYYSYVGVAMSGEFWLPGFRIAPAVRDDVNDLYRMDFERIVVFDHEVRAIDAHHARVLASQFATAQIRRLGLIWRMRFRPIPSEWIWALPNREGHLSQPSERRERRFFVLGERTTRMPEKGRECHLGTSAGSILDMSPPGSTAGSLINAPTESRPLLRVASSGGTRDVVGFDACSRMYLLSLILQPHSASAAMAYRVGAIEAIAQATIPGSSFADFIRRYVPDLGERDPRLDFLYGTVRSGHFHAGAVPLDRSHGPAFHPLIGRDYVMNANLTFQAEQLTWRAIASWLRELAQREEAPAR